MASFSHNKIAIGTILLCLVVAGIGFCSLIGKDVPWHLVVPALIIGATLVTKWAAPSIPWLQTAACCFVILMVHIAAELTEWLPAVVMADKVIEVSCVLGFGAYWVKRGYIPRWANQW